jgi:hypothetical protein
MVTGTPARFILRIGWAETVATGAGAPFNNRRRGAGKLPATWSITSEILQRLASDAGRTSRSAAGVYRDQGRVLGASPFFPNEIISLKSLNSYIIDSDSIS